MWRCALGPPGAVASRVSPVTAAWRTVASWLTTILRGQAASAAAPLRDQARRAQRLLQSQSWEYLGEGPHALALRRWSAVAAAQHSSSKSVLCWLRTTAAVIAARTERYDLRRSRQAWQRWVLGTGSGTLGRLHRFSRVQRGWTPSAVGLDDGDAFDPDEPAAPAPREEPRPEAAGCSGAGHGVRVPLSTQQAVQAEADRWGREWAAGSPLPSLPWPEAPALHAELRPLTVPTLRAAARTFRSEVGLGWDQLHPMAVLRCPDGALAAMGRLLGLAERCGLWPSSLQAVLICLLPKPQGGWRPIGLLPSIVRWWMRARLDEVRQWQSRHERPYFFASNGKAADVAAWKQAARSELAASRSGLAFACLMLDMVKAFERVPHDWLVVQAVRYHYPLAILRLSLGAYRMERVLTVDNTCALPVLPTRGITAGSVHATVELRLLLLQWLDQALACNPRLLTATVYVDDVALECSGSEAQVTRTVVAAARTFTRAVEGIGMAFSPTKNAVVASTPALADAIDGQLRRLVVAKLRGARSLGSALGGGKSRHAALQRQRLQSFRVRRVQFQKVRRLAGARRTGAVLRSGGTAALTYGQATVGVACSTLLTQRRAVAAAYSRGGCPGDLDLTLVLADGPAQGGADPAFAAHVDVLGLYADAVWGNWLPLVALRGLFARSLARMDGKASPWGTVRGPIGATLAAAARLGWKLEAPTVVVDDLGHRVDLAVDPPALVRQLVRAAVRRWRWRRLELRHPYIAKGRGGYGPFIQPLLRLLDAPPGPEWGPAQQGALRSLIAGRQWPQARRFQAGFTVTRNCQLCVRGGLCEDSSTDPRFLGTLMHRCWTCPMLEQYRQQWAPRDLLEEVGAKLRAGTLTAADICLYTRGLTQVPDAALMEAPIEASCVWQLRPRDEDSHSVAFTDGSRIDADAGLYSLCARSGWGLAIYNEQHQLIGAARGRPPWWATSIHATELWAMLMAVRDTDPFCKLWTDCRAIEQGSRKGLPWACSAKRLYARAWAPIAAALGGAAERVSWVPSHCADSGEASRTMADGSSVPRALIRGNAVADQLAKAAALDDRIPEGCRRQVREQGLRLRALGQWLGRVAAKANDCRPSGDTPGAVRDAGGPLLRASRPSKRKSPPRQLPAHSATGRGFWDAPRMAALRRRIVEREREARSEPREAGPPHPVCSTG